MTDNAMTDNAMYAPQVRFDRLLIVVVNYKSARLTLDALQSLEAELRDVPGSHVTVVENASGDGDVLAKGIADKGWSSWVTLDVSKLNGGFAYGNNRAIRPALATSAPPQYVLLLNPDTRIYPGAVKELLKFMDQRLDVGIAGSSFENDDGTDWPIAFRFPSVWSELDSGLRLGVVTKLLNNWVVPRTMEKREAEVDWVPGASMLIRREVFRDIGLMDDGYFLYHEETDFCLRARRAGWSCWYVPQSRVVHIAGQSTGVTQRDRRPPRTPDYCFESRRRYFLKNYGLAYALGADLSFGIGYGLWRVRRAVQRKPDLDPPHHLQDFWKHSVLFPRNRKVKV
jgi:N-acetylglucosaminyl-diphospho-decaprenol L-rhamnosyltransferase